VLYDGEIRREAVLKIPVVICDCIAGQDAAHVGGGRDPSGAKAEMDMIWQECPRKARRLGLTKQAPQAVEKGVAVLVIPEDPLPLDSPDHQVMDGPRKVDPRLSWHDFTLSNPKPPINLFSYGRPP
jgi:hypothetical protein